MDKIKNKKGILKYILIFIFLLFIVFSISSFILIYDNSSIDLFSFNLDDNIAEVLNDSLYNAINDENNINFRLNSNNLNYILYLASRRMNKSDDYVLLEINKDNYIFKFKTNFLIPSRLIISTNLKEDLIDNEEAFLFKVNSIKLSKLTLNSSFKNKIINDNNFIDDELINNSFNKMGLRINSNLKSGFIYYKKINAINDLKNLLENKYNENYLLRLLPILFMSNNIITNFNNGISLFLKTSKISNDKNIIFAYDINNLIKQYRNILVKNNVLNLDKIRYIYTYFLRGYDYINNKYKKEDPEYILIKEFIDLINFKNTVTVNNLDLTTYKGSIDNVKDEFSDVYKNRLLDPKELFIMAYKKIKVYPFIEIKDEDINSYLLSNVLLNKPLILYKIIEKDIKILLISINRFYFSFLPDNFSFNLDINLNGKLVTISLPIISKDKFTFSGKLYFDNNSVKINEIIQKPLIGKELISNVIKGLNLNNNLFNFSIDNDTYVINFNFKNEIFKTKETTFAYHFFTNNLTEDKLNLKFRCSENKLQYVTDNRELNSQ